MSYRGFRARRRESGDSVYSDILNMILHKKPEDSSRDRQTTETETGDSVYTQIDEIDVSEDMARGEEEAQKPRTAVYQIVTSTDDFRNRNSFLAALVFLWSLFNFTVYIRTNHEADILWACCTLIAGLGALMTMILLSRKEMNYQSVLSAIFVLLLAFFSLMAAGTFWVETKCDDSMSCGSLWFAQGVLMPSFCVLIIAMDLLKGYFENIRMRLLAYSGAIIISGTTYCISYFGQDQDTMAYSDKCTEAGFCMLTGAALYVFVVHGMFEYYKSKMINYFVSWWSIVALFFLLTSDEITNSTFAAWYLIICYFLLVINMDVHYGHHSGPDQKSESAIILMDKYEASDSNENEIQKISAQNKDNPRLERLSLLRIRAKSLNDELKSIVIK